VAKVRKRCAARICVRKGNKKANRGLDGEEELGPGKSKVRRVGGVAKGERCGVRLRFLERKEELGNLLRRRRGKKSNDWEISGGGAGKREDIADERRKRELGRKSCLRANPSRNPLIGANKGRKEMG